MSAPPDGKELEATRAALRRVESLHRLLVESVKEYAIYALDPAGRVVSWNPGAERIKGYAAAEVMGRHYSTFFLPEDVERGRPEALLREAAETGEAADRGWRLRKDGTRFWADAVVTPLRDVEGGLVGFAKVTRDLTDRRRAVEAVRRLARERSAGAPAETAEQAVLELLESIDITESVRVERRFRSLIENTVDVIMVLDRQGVIRYGSPSVERVTGHGPGELTGRSVFGLVHPEDVAAVRAEFERVIERPGATLRVEFRVRSRHGEWRLLEGVGRNLLDDPAVGGVVYNGRDITERKRAEELQRFLAEVSSALAGSLDYRVTLQRVAELAVPWFADLCLVDVVDEAGEERRVGIAYRGPGARELTAALERFPPDLSAGPEATVYADGRPRLVEFAGEEQLRAIARSPEHLRLIERIGPHTAMIAPLTTRERTLGVITFVSTDPGRRYAPADLEFAGEVARRVALSLENARLYEAALIANEAKSDFLAIISHELRTPLNSIMGYTHLLDAEIAGPLTPKQREQLGRVDESARRLLELIDEILTYARLETGRERVGFERVDLRDLVHRAAGIVAPAATERGLDFRVDVPEHPAPIDTDPPKVRQILLHLLTNAVKFTEEGSIGVEASVADGTVLIRVRDTGIGISERDHERIFDPFWQVEEVTTRRAGGAGLGLSLSRRLARLLGGDVSVASSPGEGSTFTLRLPAERPPGPGAEAA